jgi:hypothetical protein
MDYWSGFDDSYLVLKLLRKHYDVEICDDADYVFYSVMGESHWSVPDRCIKICHTGENVVPDFNACDYAIGFEWMDYGDRYIRFPLYLFYDRDLLEKMVRKHGLPADWDLKTEKPGFCSFVVSNHRNAFRNEAYERLSRYRPVASGGRFLNNVGGPVVDKFAFDSRHKFSLCFENSSHSGYTTEKLVEALAARTVPIYWGDPDVGKVFNTKSFVNVQDYASLDDALLRVRELDQDDDQYLAMLREPALLPGIPTIDEQLQGLESWLIHIFEQPMGEAGRRNRDFLGEQYIEKRLRLDCIANRSAIWSAGIHRLRDGLKKIAGK